MGQREAICSSGPSEYQDLGTELPSKAIAFAGNTMVGLGSVTA
jgi:hypothetical protein